MVISETLKSRYADALGEEEARRLLKLFAEIENGKYDKNELHTFHPLSLKHPISLRAIRADMQSFSNTFIDPYLQKKPYLSDAKYIIDAGANIGYTAALYASWWPGSSIISIEADEENYLLTKRNVAALPNVTVIHGALWNREADLKIEAGQEDGFVVREINGSQEMIRPENFTKGFSIQSLMKKYDFPRIDFLKMNIEGSEKEIFSGDCDSWLAHTQAMLIELHDGKNPGCSKAVFSAVNAYDFAVAETAPYGILFVREDAYRKWYSNWYREEIYKPNINKERFPDLYLNK
jgi:FkbM family methyltransferase